MFNGIYFILFSIVALPIIIGLSVIVIDILTDIYIDAFGPFNN